MLKLRAFQFIHKNKRMHFIQINRTDVVKATVACVCKCTITFTATVTCMRAYNHYNTC